MNEYRTENNIPPVYFSPIDGKKVLRSDINGVVRSGCTGWIFGGLAGVLIGAAFGGAYSSAGSMIWQALN